MAGPIVTQVAQSVPFEPNRNPSYPGGPSGLTATNVQDAIEEAKADAISNDRFASLCSYGGNANAGRYLEFFAGIDSSEAPIYVPTAINVIDLVAATTAPAATCTIEFVNLTPVTPVVLYTVTFTAVKRVTLAGSPLFVVPSGALLAVRVGSGSINKPHLYFYASATT